MKEKLLGVGGDEVIIIYVIYLHGLISLLLLKQICLLVIIPNLLIIPCLHLSEQAI